MDVSFYEAWLESVSSAVYRGALHRLHRSVRQVLRSSFRRLDTAFKKNHDDVSNDAAEGGTHAKIKRLEKRLRHTSVNATLREISSVLGILGVRHALEEPIQPFPCKVESA